MPKLLIASHNPGKIRELSELLHPHGITILTPRDCGITDQPAEDGETFAENSLLKANFYWQKSGNIDTLAGDGGLVIDALGGEPGVHTRRIDGKDRTDDELRALIIEKTARIPEAHRTARLTVVLTLRVGPDLNFQTEAAIEGIIKDSQLPHEPGYPIRPIFWIPSVGKFYSELTAAEHHRLSQLRIAFEKLLPYLEQYVL